LPLWRRRRGGTRSVEVGEAGYEAAAARPAAQNVRRYLRGEAITGAVRRADYQAGAG
jgi:hypothetical protein